MSRFQAVVDRIEEEKAVLLVGEESTRVIMPTNLLPDDAKEGTVISISIETDEPATAEAKSRVQKLIDKLSGDNG